MRSALPIEVAVSVQRTSSSPPLAEAVAQISLQAVASASVGVCAAAGSAASARVVASNRRMRFPGIPQASLAKLVINTQADAIRRHRSCGSGQGARRYSRLFCPWTCPPMTPNRLTLALLAALAAGTAGADEGMWVPQQLPEIAGPLKAAGMKIDPAQLADLTGHPMGAVVSLGGCTASFVSPEGLVVTNHHCAYGSIQLNSTPENNLLEKGFNAASLADEVSGGPNSRIWVTERKIGR